MRPPPQHNSMHTETITVHTAKTKEVVDITNDVDVMLKRHSVENGICHFFIPHTTAALATAYLDPERELELIGAFEVVLPHPRRIGREHEHTHVTGRVPDHVMASFLGSSLSIPVSGRKLALGEFQRVVLVELQGPETREVRIMFEA